MVGRERKPVNISVNVILKKGRGTNNIKKMWVGKCKEVGRGKGVLNQTSEMTENHPYPGCETFPGENAHGTLQSVFPGFALLLEKYYATARMY